MSTVTFLSQAVEAVDRRVLGGFRCVDSLAGKTVTDQLAVTSSGLTVRPNRAGIWVVFNAPGLALPADDFLAGGPWPAPQPFLIQVRDLAGRYLPRQATLPLPATLPPSLGANSLFSPQVVTLFAGPAMTAGANWATLHISAVHTQTGQGLPYAIVQAKAASDGTVLATGMTDSRGEALIAIPGLGVRASDSSAGAVMQALTMVTAEVFFDPSVLARPTAWLPDPDQQLLHLNDPSVFNATQTAQLGSGISQPLSFSISF